MAVVITRWKCVQEAKYDGYGGLVSGGRGAVRRQKIYLDMNEN